MGTVAVARDLGCRGAGGCLEFVLSFCWFILIKRSCLYNICFICVNTDLLMCLELLGMERSTDIHEEQVLNKKDSQDNVKMNNVKIIKIINRPVIQSSVNLTH